MAQWAPCLEAAASRNSSLFVAPDGAACVSALEKLLANGFLKPDEKMVIYNTGAGLKYLGATGPVQFFRGGTLIGSATAGGGVAQLTTNTLPGGVNSLTAANGGDANHAASTSTAVSHTVNKVNSTTTLAANPSQSRVGQTVTFTATVAPAGATGTVLFFNGSTQLGSGTISAAGQAVFSTSALPRGTHSIRANYQGDGNYNSSQSAILSYRVRN